MSDKDLQETIEALERLSERMAKSPEAALALMVKGGFLTPSGELTEPYKQRA